MESILSDKVTIHIGKILQNDVNELCIYTLAALREGRESRRVWVGGRLIKDIVDIMLISY
jgi:hypothetical protein